MDIKKNISICFSATLKEWGSECWTTTTVILVRTLVVRALFVIINDFLTPHSVIQLEEDDWIVIHQTHSSIQ